MKTLIAVGLLASLLSLENTNAQLVTVEDIRSCTDYAKQLDEECNKAPDSAWISCDPDSESTTAKVLGNLISYGGKGAIMGAAFTQGQDAGCGELSKYAGVVNGALAAFSMACNQAGKTCIEKCTKLRSHLSSTENCSNPNKVDDPRVPETTTATQQLNAIKTFENNAELGIQKCAKIGADGNQQSAMFTQAVMTVKQQATACETANKGGGGPDYCKLNPTDVACLQATGSRNCNDTSMANEPVCACMVYGKCNNGQLGKLNAGGLGPDGTGAAGAGLGAGMGGAGGLNAESTAAGGAGFGFGDMGSMDLPPGSYQAKSDGPAAGGGRGGGGGGFGGGRGSAGSGEKGYPQQRTLSGGRDSLFSGVSRGGGNNSKGSSNSYGGRTGGAGSEPSLYNGINRPRLDSRGIAAKTPNLAEFLPGGRLDRKAQALAGITGPDGITGPHSNIWQKIKIRYQAVRNTLIQN